MYGTSHPYVIDISPNDTKRFVSSCLMHTAKVWNTLPAIYYRVSENYILRNELIEIRSAPGSAPRYSGAYTNSTV